MSTPGRPGRAMRTVWTLRWLILGLTALLGLYLLSSGRVVLGGFLVVMAGLRAAMFVTVRRRRQELREQRRARRSL